jgi:hypothetical protein
VNTGRLARHEKILLSGQKYRRGGANIIVLAKFRAVKKGRLRLIRDKSGIPKIHVITGEFHNLTY